MTGIDRVELAYLRRLCERVEQIFGLARVGRDYFLLDPEGMQKMLARLTGKHSWGPRDAHSRLYRRRSIEWQMALSDLRRHAVRRCNPAGLAKTLQTSIGSGFTYLNVGHSNIDSKVFLAVKGVAESRIVVLLHDVIPLEFPQYQRPGSVIDFTRKIQIVSELADLVICPSADGQQKITNALLRAGRAPPTVVALLGVEVALPSSKDFLNDLNLSRPYFVTLGTIEPRKNHALLLDVWMRLGSDAPTLCVVGQRGWNNERVFSRLDAHAPNVIELNGLSDEEVAALLKGSAGLLFPSFAEGFGLPPAEAALLGVPAVCADLAVYREFLGDYPVYLKPTEMYLWEKTIRGLADQNSNRTPSDRSAKFPERLPTWDAHFNTVLKML